MGRDFTPYEHYISDKSMGGTLRTATFFDNEGKKIEWFKREEKKILEKYRELGFLFSECLLELWDEMSGHPRYRKEVLETIERDLEFIIENIGTLELKNNFNKTVYDWFMGKLDKNFYYSDRNNDLLKVYIFRCYSRRVAGDKDWKVGII